MNEFGIPGSAFFSDKSQPTQYTVSGKDGGLKARTRLPGYILLARFSLLLLVFRNMFRDLLLISSILTIRGLCLLSALHLRDTSSRRTLSDPRHCI